ncbi:MAG: DNA-binding protein, partial [Cardiobacterium sp.]
MYRLIESTDYPALLARYLQDYDHYSRADPLGDTPLIVPTLPVGNILIQTLASQRGIAAGITLRLWHNYEWMLVERITGKSRSSSQAPLGNTAIRWELFSYLYQHGNTILADPGHPQHALLRGLYPDTDKITHDHTRRLWVYSGQLANLYSTYLNQRPEWLSAWQNADPPPLDALLKNDSLQQLPPQIADHYRALYQQQSRLWHDRFAAIHAERERRRETFWQTLKTRESARRLLPPYIPVFAPTHLHAAEHDFMRRLGNYTDLTHYHLAASDGYIDDIVDSRWLRELKARAAGKPSGEHREHGHELLSRYGKQQRDLSRLLHADSDPEPLPATPAPPHNLLTALQAEIRELKEDHVATYFAATTPPLQSGGGTGRGCENRAATNPDHQTPQDHSLRIHGCHSLQRQCETLRSDIVAWLNAD